MHIFSKINRLISFSFVKIQEEKSQGLECQECQSMEEKEQLSPVSVMDFPYQGDEAGEASSVHFVQSLANIESTFHQIIDSTTNWVNSKYLIISK